MRPSPSERPTHHPERTFPNQCRSAGNLTPRRKKTYSTTRQQQSHPASPTITTHQRAEHLALPPHQKARDDPPLFKTASQDHIHERRSIPKFQKSKTVPNALHNPPQPPPLHSPLPKEIKSPCPRLTGQRKAHLMTPKTLYRPLKNIKTALDRPKHPTSLRICKPSLPPPQVYIAKEWVRIRCEKMSKDLHHACFPYIQHGMVDGLSK